jgi:predicted O-linked N-acetylglucosamine transferase (SPINDLY family)
MACLLKTLDLPELVAANQDAYEALAVLLTTDGQRLGEIKRRLEKSRLASLKKAKADYAGLQ